MNWDDIAGQDFIKTILKQTVAQGRISHAQLFLGKFGYGTFPLALAYAREILSSENPNSAGKVDRMDHIDLHFSFPIYNNGEENISKNFAKEFREMMLQNPYSNLSDWTEELQTAKAIQIYVDEIDHLSKVFSLKSFEGGSKILIIWGADKINEKAANKFLKFLEEPPEKTIIILLAESADFMLPTILSRVQITEIPPLQQKEITVYLEKKHPALEIKNENLAECLGDINLAEKLLQRDINADDFEAKFVEWVRDAYRVKKNPGFLKNIMSWAKEISRWSRDKQKNFLQYCIENFRLAMMQNYAGNALVYRKVTENGFAWEKFSENIHGKNIQDILDEISLADYHLDRNGNALIIWTDMGIKLTRFLHKKSN